MKAEITGLEREYIKVDTSTKEANDFIYHYKCVYECSKHEKGEEGRGKRKEKRAEVQAVLGAVILT